MALRLLTLFTLALTPLTVLSQSVVNGQIYTNGLSIVDAPQPNTPFHAGANMPIAIDISGNGRLDMAASIPGSDRSTRFDLLEIFLVSAQTQLNLTIAEGPTLLTNESGSTVKHVDYQISTCVPAGSYNLTFYETSHINNTAHYTITYLPVTIDNVHPSSDKCSGNQLATQPQPASNLTHSPWLTEDGTPVTYPVVSAAYSRVALLSSNLSVFAITVVGIFASLM
jgi:hypothetical protein